MVKRLLLKIVALAALASTAYTLTLLDQFVQGTLYSYGLRFSYDWANPYWTLFRVTWALLAVCAIATIFNTILIVRSSSKEKQRSVKIESSQKAIKSIPAATQTKETVPITAPIIPSTPSPQPSQKSTPKPAPIIAPAPSYEASDIPGLFKCAHCGKAFSQPLRMLDFQSDPPRIVNVCPFCSETMHSVSTVKESEQVDKRSPSKKNNNQGQKPFTVRTDAS